MSKYKEKKYVMGIALQTTKSHPWGKGAFSGSKSAEELVKEAEDKGLSDKRIAAKARMEANITENTAPSSSIKARAVEHKANEKAHEKGEYKGD